MARGFLSGVMWGSLLSLGVAGTVSVFSDGPPKPDVAATAPDAASPDVAPSDATAPTAAEPDTTPEIVAPEAIQPAENAPEPVAPDTTPSSAPEVGAQTADLPDPADPAQTGAVSVEGETPAPDMAQSAAPQAPQSDAAATVSAESAQPAIPDVAEPEQTPAAPDMQSVTAPAPEAAAPESVVDGSDPAPVPVPDAEPDVDTATAEAPAPTAPEALPETPPATPDAEQEQPADTEQAQVEAEAEEPPSGTGIGTPASDLSKLAPEVATNRLPSLGDEAPVVAPAPDDQGTLDFNAELPPILRYGAPFDNPDDKPLMAIVLMDDGTGISGGAAGAEALSAFPYPITFAIDTGLPDAADKMARYRAAGFEVMAMIDLPEASSASDTEVSMSVALAAVPEAVAVLEGTATGFQGNREMSDQVTAILSDGGMGMVTQPKGLNTVQKLASRDGVPAATLFRDFDGAGQDAAVIRRFLDQAAFKAGQEGGVIMVGRLRPDTVSALLLWGLQDRAGRVALAPVSAVLTAQ